MTPEEKHERLTLLLGLLLVPLVIGVGIYASLWRSQEVDNRLRNELLSQCVEIASTVSPSLVKELTFTEADLMNPAYQRIRAQMVAYGHLIRQRGIYSEALRGDQILFGPENYAEGDPMGAGPPGTPYLQPDDVDFMVLQTGIPAVVGPATDEYGTFVSALAPVFDPVSGEILMMVGIDILADEWQKEVRTARITPLIITVIVILIQLVCFILIYLRNKGVLRNYGPWKFLEVFLVSFTGIVLTASVTVVFLDQKTKEHELLFQLRNQTIVNNLREDFREVQKSMYILKNFMDNSEVVTESEFQLFTETFELNFSQCSFLWIDRKSSTTADSTRVEDTYEIRFHTPLPDFMVSDSSGSKWIPPLNELLSESEKSGLVQSTVTIFPNGNEEKRDVLVAILQAKEGFILTLLDIKPFMNYSLLKSSLTENEFTIGLIELERTKPGLPTGKQPFFLKTPLFVFGNAFALITTPSAEIDRSYISTDVLGAVIPGLILTLLTALFVRFLTRRQADLEKMVASRSVELTRAKEKAEESDRLKSTFLANMSHEIRTPMNAIVGFSQILAEPDLPPDERSRMAEIVQRRSDDLLHIINDILDLSRIESGNVSSVLSKVSLNDILDELETIFRGKILRLNKPNLSLRIEKPLKDDSAWIVTDPYLLRQVFTNLIDNAIKFTPAGTITFGYMVPEHEVFTFYVSDTGIGISPQNQEIIFDHFRQADPPAGLNNSGSGLGLSICKGFIQLLGGEIRVESATGAGSTFLFKLPDSRMEIPEGAGSPSTEPMAKEISSKQPSWHGKRFLLVEDDESNQEYLQTILRRSGADLISISSARELKELFNDLDSFDLVLLDVRLPDGIGWQLSREIKQRKPTLPVIIQTAYAMTTDQLKSEASGSDGYISKPIRKDELLAVIRRVMNRSESLSNGTQSQVL